MPTPSEKTGTCSVSCVLLAGWLIVMLVLACSGCAPQYRTPPPEMPTINVPAEMRQRNWRGNQNEGSCVHANIISLLRWQGRPRLADSWKRSHGNGESPGSMARQLDHGGIRYAYVTNGDVRFLEWCISTRRGCGITVKGGRHMVTLVHMDETQAAILDNNRPGKFIWMPRNTLISEWKSSKGWAITPVYTPAAPLP